VPVDDEARLARTLHALSTDPVEWERLSARNLELARRYEFQQLDARYQDWLARIPRARRP
jgi:hypothetical protein